jgi:hypothetical protein
LVHIPRLQSRWCLDPVHGDGHLPDPGAPGGSTKPGGTAEHSSRKVRTSHRRGRPGIQPPGGAWPCGSCGRDSNTTRGPGPQPPDLRFILVILPVAHKVEEHPGLGVVLGRSDARCGDQLVTDQHNPSEVKFYSQDGAWMRNLGRQGAGGVGQAWSIQVTGNGWVIASWWPSNARWKPPSPGKALVPSSY